MWPIGVHGTRTLVVNSGNGRFMKTSHLNQGTMSSKDSFNHDKLTEAAQLTQSGSDCEYRGNFEEAQRHYEEALALYEDMLGLENLTTAKTIASVARVCRRLGKTAEASLLEDQADAIFRQFSGGQPARDRTPFGGSSGFWELLGAQAADSNDGDGAAAGQMGSEY